jgi:hypothetical protein
MEVEHDEEGGGVGLDDGQVKSLYEEVKKERALKGKEKEWQERSAMSDLKIKEAVRRGKER